MIDHRKYNTIITEMRRSNPPGNKALSDHAVQPSGGRQPSIPPVSPKLKSYFPVLFLLSTLSFLGIIWWVFQKTPNHSQNWFAAYYQPFEMLVPVESNGHPYSLRNQALQAYHLAQYDLALEFFKQVPLDDRTNLVAFYEAQALLAKEHTREALSEFTDLMKSEPFSFREDSEWYLALSHLRLEHFTACEKVLRNIIAYTKHPYRTKAMALLSELEHKL